MIKFKLHFLLFIGLIGVIPFVLAEEQYKFTNWDGVDLPVFVAKPSKVNKATRLVVVMHGRKRNAEEYRDQWLEAAKDLNLLVIVPEFSEENFPQVWGFNYGNIKTAQSEPIEQKLHAYSAIGPLATEALETFKLKSNNVNFSSNTNPIKPKRQKEDQLYKSIIKGNLINEVDKKVKLEEALVYKRKLDTDDQILVINIGEEPGEDAIIPLFRHSENIQSKCGTRLLNQWGWMSFISMTKNEKIAKNQQCHYDYFKETDDVEAIELFESVLSGTDSILNYLQANVK